MRVSYQIERRELAEGEVDLDWDMAAAWPTASQAERRRMVEPLIRDHADLADDWVLEESLRYLPDDEETR